MTTTRSAESRFRDLPATMNNIVCQQCKEPLEVQQYISLDSHLSYSQLDSSLADLAPSAYDMIVGSLPPTPVRPESDNLSQFKATEASRTAWQKSKNSSTRAPRKQAGPLPNESFVLLQDSIVRSIPSPASSPISKKGSTSRTTSTKVAQPPPKQDEPTHPNPSPLSHHLRSTVRLFNLLSARTDIDHPLCAECTQILLASLQRQLDETKRERDGYIAFEKEVRKERERDGQGMSKEEAEKKIEKLKLDERLAIEQLKVAEQERVQLDEELRALEEEEKALEQEEARSVSRHGFFLAFIIYRIDFGMRTMISYYPQNSLARNWPQYGQPMQQILLRWKSLSGQTSIMTLSVLATTAYSELLTACVWAEFPVCPYGRCGCCRLRTDMIAGRVGGD
jgi:beclin 1